MAPKPFLRAKRASVSEARLAYFDGDFEHCLELCSHIQVRSLSTASEVALLTARANLRTGRAREAESAILASADTHVTLDASLTAQMLLGAARIRQGDEDAGIAVLKDAAARSDGAHVTVRSEISFCTALGYWAKRDIDSAERYLAQVDRSSDIIHARALELLAWCQMARGNYRRCAELFILTLLRLDTCRASDRAIAATAISTLSILAAEMFDREIARLAEHRADTMEWSSALVAQQHLTLLHQALFYELSGNTTKAYELAMQAREIAPSVPFEAYGWSVSSVLARNAGEKCAAVVCAQRAQRLLERLDLRELTGEERFSILAVAESCAHFDSRIADRLFAAYWGLAPADKMRSPADDPRLVAEETLIAGVIAEARGDVAAACHSYRQAFERFARIGYVRRALMAAFSVVSLCGDDSMRTYVMERLAGTTNYITNSLIGRPQGASLR